MKNYKLSVSKNGKKYTIVFKAETEKLARERVHKEGYSILSIEENLEKIDLGNTFLFTASTKNGEIKNGRIVGDDIFKVYVKLRKNLEYNVISLYSEADKNLDDYKKNNIVRNLKEEYELFFNGKKTDKLDELREKIKKDKEENKKMDNFYLKKELEETYKLIDFVLNKIENLLEAKSGIVINTEQTEKLKKIFNLIIKLKKTTNISKLKEIGELALLKVGKIELKELEEKQDKKTKILLKETNKLLRQLGSKESFIEKNRDIGYIINNISNKITEYFKNFNKNKKNEIDKMSHSYNKNILYLKRYQEKLKENNIFLLKNFIGIFLNSEKVRDAFIRRKVIKQNILLLKAREKGFGFSYTFIKNRLDKIINVFLIFIKNIRESLFIVIFLYTVIFLFFLNINIYYKVMESNYNGIYYFIIIFIIYLIFYITRNLFFIILNFVILFIIIIFGVVNF